MGHDKYDDAQPIMEKGKDEMKQSGRDWVNYIQEHPIQSIAFGITMLFALKGMLQD